MNYCSTCGEYLGSLPVQSTHVTELSNDEFKYNTWVAKHVGEWLAHMPTSRISPDAGTLAENLSQLANIITSGNIRKFARELQMTDGVIERACSGKRSPSLRSLLELCYQLNISPLNLVSSTPNIVNYVDYNSPFFQRQKTKGKVETIADNSHYRKKNTDRSEVEAFLQALLVGSSPPPSLSKISETLGIHVKTLRYHAPALCKQIVNRRQELRASGVKLDAGSLIRSTSKEFVELLTPTELQDRLLSCLEEDIPRTVREIAEELGYSIDILYDYHAELCYRITERWRNFQSESRKKSIEQACKEVRQAVLQLHSQGAYISSYAVSKLLSKPAYMRDEEVYSLFLSLKNELEK
ncbi:hypothetical protein H6F67_04530 [Microcoleus sp. FACHB-1515]|uniref:hypothetical protein n=1 Tax=Cyanophyceae TaxID=3028117 RepID=UPI0016843FE2|nr:hypothetical protein [Microcoleus sp. FACHB-1515]MBD2089120.1 hypothetical protein [Microcoleus sp. FACHB-1515]